MVTEVHFPSPLLPFHGQVPPAPDWFTAALADAPQRTEVLVQGTPVETLVWGRAGDPGLLLMHGNGAHADWYSFIAPLLARAGGGRRVVAFSYSGMGRSGWRTAYSVSQWADEAFAVAQATGLLDAADKPLVAAHSFGGFPLMTLAARHGGLLKRAVIMDTPLAVAGASGERFRAQRAEQARSGRVYPTLAQALARFKLLPPQGCDNPFIADHIARHGLKTVVGPDGQPGWVWRLDPFLFRHFHFGQPQKDLAQAACPVLLVRGGRSRLMSPGALGRLQAVAPPGTPTAELADADHHLMIDQPLGLVDLLGRAMDPQWPGVGDAAAATSLQVAPQAAPGAAPLGSRQVTNQAANQAANLAAYPAAQPAASSPVAHDTR